MPAFLFALLTCSLAYAAATPHSSPEPLRSEVTAPRWVTQIPGVYYREYDLPGSKSETFLGNSSAGSPSFLIPRLGFSAPEAILPEANSGLFSDRLSFDPWALSLNGENGVLLDSSGLHSPLDTPRVLLDWQRSAFSGNGLRMEFQRSLVDSVFLDLGLVTQSTDSSGKFRYQDITHQPYLGTLKRDSTRIPLSGRNLAFDNFTMLPRIVWFFPKGSLEARATFFRLSNDDATRTQPIADSTDKWTLKFPDPPFNVHTSATSVGFAANLHPTPGLQLDWWHHYTTLEDRWKNVPIRIMDITSHDTLIPAGKDPYGDSIAAHTLALIDTLRSTNSFQESSTMQTGLADLGLPNLHTKLSLQYQTRIFSHWRRQDFADKDGYRWEDREFGMASFADTLHIRSGWAQGRIQAGLQRHSDGFDSVRTAPAISVQGSAWLLQRLLLNGAVRRDTRFADPEQTFLTRSGRILFANPDLKPEVSRISEASMGYHAAAFSYGLSIRHEALHSPIRMGWLAHPRDSALADSIAFKPLNMDSAGNVTWGLMGGFRLGNWDFWLERRMVLDRWLTLPSGECLPAMGDVPEKTYKGTVAWSRTAVKERLGIHLRWDFEWIGDRQDFALGKDGQAIRIDLRHYLVLNFEARMKIKTFDLYTRIENLNHSKYMPAAGYAPPGVNFRYGIEWELGG